MSRKPSLADQPPDVRRALEAERARSGLMRTAILWTPLFAVAGSAFLYFLIQELTGPGQGWFLIIVLALVSFLMGYQSLNAIRDLVRGTSEIEGRITRRWARRDSLIMQSHYVRVDDDKIIRIDGLLHPVDVGDQVRIVYYPGSMLAVNVERLREDDEVPAAKT